MNSICLPGSKASAQAREPGQAFWNVLREDQMPLALPFHPTKHTLLVPETDATVLTFPQVRSRLVVSRGPHAPVGVTVAHGVVA